MSNKQQLQTNNTSLDNCIARINAAKEVAAGLPEAGGSSGGSDIATCTIEIINNTKGKIMESLIDELWFVAYENGECKGYGGQRASSSNILPADFEWDAEKNTLNNVICGSMIYLSDIQGCFSPPSGDWYINMSSNYRYLIVPLTPNVTHTLIMDVPF